MYQRHEGHTNYNIVVDKQVLPETHPLFKEWDMIQRVGNLAVTEVISGLSHYSNSRLELSNESWNLVSAELEMAQDRFFSNLMLSNELALEALKNNGRENMGRITYPDSNDAIRTRIETIRSLAHKKTPLWMLEGILISKQGGGLKTIAGAENGHVNSEVVHDMTVSAAANRYGSDNPYLQTMTYIQNHLENSGQPMFHYHPSELQGYAMQELASMHPNENQVKNGEIRVYTRHSGSEVNTTAIEIACAYAADKYKSYYQDAEVAAEMAKPHKKRNYKIIKQAELNGKIIVPKVFAVGGDWGGTWAGGHSGAATEATGFGVDEHANLHTGGEAWAKRVLPLFTKENWPEIRAKLEEAINKKECAGIIIEPDAIVDVGIVPVDKEVLKQVKDLLAQHGLPIIADCIQENGSMGSYLGDNTVNVLGNYDKLIITNAKAAALDPYGYMLIPREIDEKTTDMSHLSTPTYNGPHLQALVVEKMANNPEFQAKLKRDSDSFDRIAKEAGIPIEDKMAEIPDDIKSKDVTLRLRGKGMNRAWVVGEKYANMAALFMYVKYGVLFTAASGVLRDQRNLMEFSSTHEDLTKITCVGLREFEAWRNKNMNSRHPDELWQLAEKLGGNGALNIVEDATDDVEQPQAIEAQVAQSTNESVKLPEIIVKDPLVRFAKPGDYDQIEDVISNPLYGAWPGIDHNTQHDIVAMTQEMDDNGASPTIPVLVDPTTKNIFGVSINLLRAMSNGNPVLYVHMLGVDKKYRGQGHGDTLMQLNYNLILKNELKGVEQVKLTSDPLESSLVRFYMHRFGMQVSHYKPGVYSHLSESGGSQNRGIPSDRFFYESRPTSAWVEERRRLAQAEQNDKNMPHSYAKEYREYVKIHPESVENFDRDSIKQDTYSTSIDITSPIAFVELPESLEETRKLAEKNTWMGGGKQASNEIGIRWRTFQKENFEKLFTNGHTAVDYVELMDKNGVKHNYIVTMRNFDENNPNCLKEALNTGDNRFFRWSR